MQEMSGQKARSVSSLLDMRDLCVKNGSSLSMVGYLRWIAKLQGFSPIPDIHDIILCSLLRRIRNLGLEGGFE